MIRKLLAALTALALAACNNPAAPGAGAKFDPNTKIDPVLADVWIGDPNAPVEIVEWGSLLCPHCRDFWKQEMPQLKAKYIDTGKVKYAFRDLAVGFAPDASDAAAIVARCAGKDKYYATVEDFFTSQFEVNQAIGRPGGIAGKLGEIGGRAGLSSDQINACLNSKAAQDYLAKQASMLPKTSTGLPTVVVSGEHIANPTLENLYKAIDAKLGIAPAPAASPAAASPAAATTASPSPAAKPPG